MHNRSALVILLLLLVPLHTSAQSAGTAVVFPSTTNTGISACPGTPTTLSGADGGTVSFGRGNFFLRDGMVWFGTTAGLFGNPGCSNTFFFSFSPAATDVTFVLRNFDVVNTNDISVFVTDGQTSTTTHYVMGPNGSVPISVAGPVLFVDMTSHNQLTAIGVTDVRVGHQPAANSGIMAFDFPSTAPDARILISKRSGDTFPSAWQVASQSGVSFKVSGTLYDAVLGQPKAGTVYLRIDDPPDPSLYAVGDSHVGDNFPSSAASAAFVGGPGLGVPFTVTADTHGRFEATVTTSSQVAGNNYRIRGSVDPALNCTSITPCADTGVFTLWKRVYVEEEHMFRSGAFVTQTAPAGAGEVRVSDPVPFRFLTPGASQLELIHADFAGEGFYSDVMTFQALQQDASGQWMVRLTSSLPREYGSSTPIQLTAYTAIVRDAVGVIAAGTLQPADQYVAPLYETMFTEIASAPVPAIQELPFVPEFPDTQTLSFFNVRWLQTGTTPPGNPFARKAAPNTLHRTVVARKKLVQSNGGWGAELGLTSVHAGSNWSTLFAQTVADLTQGTVFAPNGARVGAEYQGRRTGVVLAETTAHETTHFWVWSGGDGQGHCSRLRWRHDVECLMHRPYSGAGLDDGIVDLHYEDHGNDSEYMTVRRAADPVPQP
jgi:hypothetical protein